MRKSSRVFTTFGLLVILSMLLTACVAPAAPSGSTAADHCSRAAATGELPVLDFYFVAFQYKDEDLAQVEAAANEILSKEISATVKFHPMTFTDAPTKGSLVLNSGEPCDLMVFSGFNPFAPAVTTGGLLPLDDLLPKYAPDRACQLPGRILERGEAGRQDLRHHELPGWRHLQGSFLGTPRPDGQIWFRLAGSHDP